VYSQSRYPCCSIRCQDESNFARFHRLRRVVRATRLGQKRYHPNHVPAYSHWLPHWVVTELLPNVLPLCCGAHEIVHSASPPPGAVCSSGELNRNSQSTV
jgi:hypothetical protein